MKRKPYAKLLCTLLGTILSIGGVFAFDVEFDSNLDDFFPNFDDVYTELHFNQGGNDFGGLIFWLATVELDSPVNIDMTNDTEDFDCNKQIQALYHNPQRGNSVWPLDDDSLNELQQMDSSYNNITLVGGLYTDCDGKSKEDVYGQISHSLGSADYRIVAGVTFDGNSYEQDFDDSLEYFEADEYAEGKLFDSRWGVASLIQPGGGRLKDFSFPIERNADLDEFVVSEGITIDGLDSGEQVLAWVSKGVLLINEEAVWSTWYVENDDSVSIELKSADEYDAVASSTLIIGSDQATFYVVTKKEWYRGECDLDLSEKMRVYSIFELLKNTYDGDPYKEESFLYTLKSMLEDRIDLNEEDCGPYQYLLDITEAYLLDEPDYDDDDDREGLYIAPNCKEYMIDYDNNRQAYYSEDFYIVHYFISMEAIQNYIDEYNPGDHECQHSSDEDANDLDERDIWVAPNGKVYEIRQATRGYTSDDFIYAKSFDTLEAIRKYIDMNNPKIAVRDHDVDEEFEPEIYIAPNEKEYKIQKVFVREDGEDSTKYMSYKFVHVKYFDSLEAIKSHIDQYNPK